MGKETKIEWCDHTWNPWIGCTEVGPACDFCYARELAQRYGWATWGSGEDRYRTKVANWNEPLRWNRAAAEAGRTETVFCLSLGDIWDNEVDPEWRYAALDVMRKCPNLLFLLLSKRIGNAIKMATGINGFGVNRSGLPANCALGATMIDQEEWDRDVGKLQDAGRVLGARFIFASVEPMLGPIDMQARGIYPDWVICGGESGSHARPMHPQWARDLRDQCAAFEVPFLFKQWGEWAPFYFRDDGEPRRSFSFEDRVTVHRIGKNSAGRALDNCEHDGKPLAILPA